MPLTFVPQPTFPDVPPGPGVPPVRRDPFAPLENIRLVAADAATVLQMFQPPQWGIFTQDGFPALLADAVLAVDFRREWRLSDYPVEAGGFETYNKVAIPYDNRVSLVCSGTLMPISTFLTTLDNMATSLDLFVVSTPDVIYPNVNIIHYDYRRETRRGAGLIVADVWLEQVRSTVRTQFTRSKDADGASPVSNGTVQAVPATPTQAAAAHNPVGDFPASSTGTGLV